MVPWTTARRLAMSLPEAHEQDHFGGPSFRVGGKIFAQLSAADSAEVRALVKLSVADQTALNMMDPHTFLPAPHWGRHGWTYIELLTVDEATLESLMLKSWRAVAPKKSIALSDAGKK